MQTVRDGDLDTPGSGQETTWSRRENDWSGGDFNSAEKERYIVEQDERRQTYREIGKERTEKE